MGTSLDPAFPEVAINGGAALVFAFVVMPFVLAGVFLVIETIGSCLKAKRRTPRRIMEPKAIECLLYLDFDKLPLTATISADGTLIPVNKPLSEQVASSDTGPME